MANAYFFYYPDIEGTLERIDLGENLSDLQVTPQRTIEDAYSLSGTMYRTVSGGSLLVRIVDDRFTDDDLAYTLESMWTHLELGGFCGACNDATQAWAGFASSPPQRGDTTIVTAGNAFSAYTDGLTTATLVSGDIICIQSGLPGLKREYLKVSSKSGGTITLSEPVRYNYPSGSTIMVRHRDFYPILRAPEGSIGMQPVTHDRRISYTLDISLEEAHDAIAAIAALGNGFETAASGFPLASYDADRVQSVRDQGMPITLEGAFLEILTGRQQARSGSWIDIERP